jgi:hypothetical protein
MYQKCIDQQTPSEKEPGAELDRGEFFRNLKKNHVVKRYEGDDNEKPRFGFKIHKRHWNYAQQQTGPLSVNQKSCIHSEVCSIALQPGNDDYYHVAVINLQSLNREIIEMKSDEALFLVASYQPLENNRCHFELIPKNGTTLAWMAIAAFFDDPFPPGKMPADKEEERKADVAFKKFSSCIQIIRNVRDKNKSLGCCVFD